MNYTIFFDRVCGGFKPLHGHRGGEYGGPDGHFGHRRDDQHDLVRRSAGGCSKVPKQSCRQVVDKKPRQVCASVAKPSCVSKPRQVHKQECNQVPVQECNDVKQETPKEVCSSKVVKSCKKVPRKIPRQVIHKVPTKHCEKMTTNRSGPGYHLVGVLGGHAGSQGNYGYIR